MAVSSSFAAMAAMRLRIEHPLPRHFHLAAMGAVSLKLEWPWMPRSSWSSRYGGLSIHCPDTPDLVGMARNLENLGDFGSELEATNEKRLSLSEGQLVVFKLKMPFRSEQDYSVHFRQKV